MPSSASQRRSPALPAAPTPSSSRDASAVQQIAAYASSTDIPSTAELTDLLRALRSRKRQLLRRLDNVQADEKNILAGKTAKAEVRRTTLWEVLDSANVAATSRRSRSPSPASSKKERPTPLNLAAPAVSNKLGKARSVASAASPPPSHPVSVTAASPGAATPGDNPRTKIKVKREPEARERERSIGAASVVSAAGSNDQSTSQARPRTRGDSELSPGLDADWDDEGPTRPARTYLNNRKRNRASAAATEHGDSADEMSHSEVENTHPGSTSRPHLQHGESSFSRRDSMFSSGHGNSSSFKLKLHPTAQTVTHKLDSFSGGLLRRPSGFRGGDEFGQVPLTPFQIQQAAMWELPKRTAETFIPTEAQPRQLRSYPIKPNEVDVDFASMDWRERDRERDRLEAASAAANGSMLSTPTGPGPGQAVVKESAMSRARDRKQDQVAFHTFQQWCDGWFRTLTEEDLAWLSSKSDDLEPFSIPSLGRYYRDVWEEEEATGAVIPTVYLLNSPYSTTPLAAANAGSSSTSNGTAAGKGHATGGSAVQLGKTPKFDPRQLKDDHLFAGSLDDVRGGPFTERLLSALLPTPPPSDSSAGPGENGSSSQPNGTGGLVLISGHGGGSAGVSQDMADYEERLARELKAIDVLGSDDTVDWSDRTDDEISSTLRKVQGLLRKQMRINEARKSRLFEIAMDRMAYQDYVACLTSVEREIESGWLRRQTQIKKSMQAQKKKKGGSNSTGSAATATGATVSGAAVVAANAIGDLGGGGGPTTANSPAAGTPGGSTSMTVTASGQGFVPENRGGGPIKPQFSESLIGAMAKRRQLRFAFEPMFADRPLAKETPRGDDTIYAEMDPS